MKKYKVRAKVSFYTDIIVKAENKQTAYETVEGVMSFDDLLRGRGSELNDEVVNIIVKKAKKHE